MRGLGWGAGAIRGTVAANAVRAGRDVMLVAAIREEELRMKGPIEECAVRAPALARLAPAMGGEQ